MHGPLAWKYACKLSEGEKGAMTDALTGGILYEQMESDEVIMAEVREAVLEVRWHGDDQESLARYTAFFQESFSPSLPAG